jgi:hypothetical protein
MKTPLKFFLAAFVSFALILSVISTKEARADQVQECISTWPAIESISYFVQECICHGEHVDQNRCQTEFGCHLWCYQVFCESL